MKKIAMGCRDGRIILVTRYTKQNTVGEHFTHNTLLTHFCLLMQNIGKFHGFIHARHMQNHKPDSRETIMGDQ